MSNKNYKLAFKNEQIRKDYAERLELNKLKTMYSHKLEEIPDLNTKKLWDDLNFKHSQDNNNFMENHKLNVVKKWLKDSNKILNIGFGSANLEEKILPYYQCTWVGIDISEKSIRYAKNKFKSATFQLGDAKKLEFSDHSFDTVVMLEVLEHIPPKYTLKVLSEIHRVLKKNGKFILSVPLNEGLEQLISKNQNPNAHVRDYSIPLVQAELSVTGFKENKRKVFYAFSNGYHFKNIITYILKNRWVPNGLLIESIKK